MIIALIVIAVLEAGANIFLFWLISRDYRSNQAALRSVQEVLVNHKLGIDGLEEAQAKADKELEEAVNQFEAQLAAIATKVAELSKTTQEVKETSDDEKAAMEERIAERVMKKWDDGLQSIINYNPLTGKQESGDDE